MKRRVPVVVLFGLLFALVFVACSDNTPPRFPHAYHLTQVKCGGPGLPDCLSCPTCHQVAKAGARPLPEIGICTRCHTKQGDKALASARPPEDPNEIVSHTVHFAHAKHLANPEIKGQCVRCHAGAVEGGRLFPTMKTCFNCHEHQKQWDNAQCSPCHERRDLERLMPQTFLRHSEGFLRKHGRFARAEQKKCQQCHTQAQCNDCHDVTQDLTVERRRPEAIDRNFVHRGDWITRHPIEARSQPTRCATCHTPDTCDACHVERGVSANARLGVNPHPVGWIGPDTQGPNFHGRQARRDILLCAGCHDQGPATNCIRCHKVGGYGGNPHPNGWKSSRSESAEMCRYCHE